MKVFLSTDAGGVGINLQAASAVINVEPPWNPARLEQRIARVHRMGQLKPVLAVHLLTENSIEERVWETVRLKKALFEGLFDGARSEVSFEKLGRRSMMETLKQIVPEAAPATETDLQKTDGKPSELNRTEPSARSESDSKDGPGRALGILLEAGIKFLESLSLKGSDDRGDPGADTAEPRGVDRALQAKAGARPKHRSGHFTAHQERLRSKDSAADQPALHIPLPSSLTSERIAQTITAALSRLTAGR